MSTSREGPEKRHSWPAWLLLAGGAQTVVYVVCFTLFEFCKFGTTGAQRPILAVLITLTISFVLYLLTLWMAVKKDAQQIALLIILFAVVFRLIMIFSQPFQEIDYNRYLWDGNSWQQGVNATKFSPSEVVQAKAQLEAGEFLIEQLTPDLAKLVRQCQTDAALSTILHRIHYGQYTTPYPPVSQFVFWVSEWTTQTFSDGSLNRHIQILKCWLVAFDMATIFVLLWLVRFIGIPDAWLLAYAWCPLVIKEFANSSHLDSIAVFFATAAIAVTVYLLFGKATTSRLFLGSATIGVLLGLSISAKLFALVLVPLIGWSLFRKLHFVWATTMSFCCLAVVIGCIIGMYPSDHLGSMIGGDGEANQRDGLVAFLNNWRMNDFAFMIVQENIEPPSQQPGTVKPWFVFIPDSPRARISSFLSQQLGDDSFAFTRKLFGLVFFAIAVWIAIRPTSRVDPQRFLNAAFLTVALFWFSLPTGNPWYWIWAMPLVCFSRNRGWFLVSGMVLIYYVRFWFAYHNPTWEFMGQKYVGENIFHFLIVWLEYLPMFAAIAIGRLALIRVQQNERD